MPTTPLPFHYAVVWIDHREARVFHLAEGKPEAMVIRPDNPTRHIHHKANSIGSGHADEDQKFLHAVTEAVVDAREILITGPANEKDALAKHMRQYDPRIAEAIVGTETVDHPSDPELVALARRYFRAADRMRQQ
jgi:stalled ribosome rescue protein Dom34